MRRCLPNERVTLVPTDLRIGILDSRAGLSRNGLASKVADRSDSSGGIDSPQASSDAWAAGERLGHEGAWDAGWTLQSSFWFSLDVSESLDEIVEELWEGKPDHWSAMERIYPRLRPILVARAYRQLSNETRAADVADEALTRVLRLVIEERSKFENARHLTRYLLVTLASRIVDRRRLDQRYQEPASETDESTDRFERMVASETEGADVSDQERDELVRNALNALSPLDRVAVELSYLKELSSEDAGVAMGVTPGAFKTRVSRAMQTLRKWGTQWRLI